MSSNTKNKRETAKRIREWTKILKDDRDWDWTNILTIFIYKLERTANTLQNGSSVEGPKEARKIRKICKLISKVRDHDFEEEVRKRNDNLHKTKVKLEREPYTDKLTRVKFVYTLPKGYTEEEYRADHLQATKLAQSLRKETLQEAFGMIVENLWNWWD